MFEAISELIAGLPISICANSGYGGSNATNTNDAFCVLEDARWRAP